MKKFLTLKHWQLFVILMGVPMIFQFVLIASVITSNNPKIIFVMFPVMMILFMGFFFGWFYALGTNLYNKLPETVTMNLSLFKIFIFIPVAYMLFLCVFLFGIFSNLLTGKEPNIAIFILIIPLHLFSMFCMFYSLYFVAKALKAVEWQKPVTFSDFAGEFCMIWFFPVGIWIIQPRINKLFDPSLNNVNQTV
ncbi:MAG: hypothetical protein JWN78_3046 [Bacteroidota bacterium]|nr:hypothetical protein [Bacteroidota bacterium]